MLRHSYLAILLVSLFIGCKTTSEHEGNDGRVFIPTPRVEYARDPESSPFGPEVFIPDASITNVSVGSAANDGTGDTLRGAFQKLNANDNMLLSLITNLPSTGITNFGAIRGDALSDTAAFNRAQAFLVSEYGGGTIEFNQGTGFYLGNFVVTNGNIRLVGYDVLDVNVNTTSGLAPFDLSLPTVQFGDDTRLLNEVRMEGLAVFGAIGGSNAPSALYMPGGVRKVTVRNCGFISGADTVYIKAGTLFPSYLITIHACSIWEGTNSTIRVADIRPDLEETSFATGIYISDTYLNGDNDSGHTIFADRARINLINVYKDSTGNFSVKLQDNGRLSAYNTDLENESGPGVNLIDIVSTTEDFTDFDPSRYINGNMRIQGTIRWTGLTTTSTNSLPTDDGGGGLNFLMDRSLLRKPRLIGPFSIATVLDPFTREYQWDLSSTNGSLWQYKDGFKDFTLRYLATNTFFEFGAVGEDMRVFFDAPLATTEDVSFEMFRGTDSSGVESLRIFKGNDSADIQHDFTTSQSYVNYQAGNFGIGTNVPSAKLHVVGGHARFEGHILFGGTGLGIYWGDGDPEGVIAAPVGSTFHRKNGGAGTSFYAKEIGTGNTGWVAK